MAGVLSFWNRVLPKVRPNAIVGEIACASEWVGYCVAQSLGIEYLIPYMTPSGYRVFFARSPQGTWEEAETAYLETKRRSLTADEMKTAEVFLDTFRAGRVKPPFLAAGLRSPVRIDIGEIIKRIKRIPFRVQTYWEDGFFEVGSYHGTPPWEPLWHDVRKVLRYLAQQRMVFRSTIPEGKKVYFPLHVQPEYTTDVRAPFYTNQFAIVENIAKSIPIGYRVVVKEHPGMKGERTFSYYRQFR